MSATHAGTWGGSSPNHLNLVDRFGLGDARFYCKIGEALLQAINTLIFVYPYGQLKGVGLTVIAD